MASPSSIFSLTSAGFWIKLCQPPSFSFHEQSNTLCIPFSLHATATLLADATDLADKQAQNFQAGIADMCLGGGVVACPPQNYPDTVGGSGVYISGCERS
ncbi:hypothetical protein ABEW05_010533 [Botrytis cinerea]